MASKIPLLCTVINKIYDHLQIWFPLTALTLRWHCDEFNCLFSCPGRSKKKDVVTRGTNLKGKNFIVTFVRFFIACESCSSVILFWYLWLFTLLVSLCCTRTVCVICGSTSEARSDCFTTSLARHLSPVLRSEAHIFSLGSKVNLIISHRHLCRRISTNLC